MFVCVFSVYPLLLRTPGQQKADLCRETLKRRCCPARRDQETLSSVKELLLLATDLKNTHTSTQIVVDNRTCIHTQMHEEETDLNCCKPLSIPLLAYHWGKKSHYDKWLISEHICREPWRKRDLNRPSLSSPPQPFKSKDTLCLNSGLLSTSHLHEC